MMLIKTCFEYDQVLVVSSLAMPFNIKFNQSSGAGSGSGTLTVSVSMWLELGQRQVRDCNAGATATATTRNNSSNRSSSNNPDASANTRGNAEKAITFATIEAGRAAAVQFMAQTSQEHDFGFRAKRSGGQKGGQGREWG
ncbi:hypothetical protein ACLKA6_012423 [Drosophila palustris]